MTAKNIYDSLNESHDKQRKLCKALLKTKAGTQERVDTFTDLRIELAAHAAAEERFLYAPILMHDAGLWSARHALHEHHAIDELIEDLQTQEHAGPRWMANAKKLTHQVLHHLREEEKKFFPVSGKLLSETQKVQAGAKYRKDYQRMREELQNG